MNKTPWIIFASTMTVLCAIITGWCAYEEFFFGMFIGSIATGVYTTFLADIIWDITG